jgi:hypothetical protein
VEQPKEIKMSEHMLNIVGATRMNNSSAIVGDWTALNCLREALDDALASGSGGASTYSSDGEPHAVAVILVDDMYPVYTTYADEHAPLRSGRETVPIKQLVNYSAAVRKAEDPEHYSPANSTFQRGLP